MSAHDPAAPRAAASPPHGLAAVVAGLGASVVASAVAAGIAVGATDYDATAPTGTGAYVGRVAAQVATGAEPSAPGFPLWLIALLQIPLWVGFVGALVWVARAEGRSVAAAFGFRFRRRDVGIGLLVGALTQLLLVPALYLPLFWLLGERDLSGPARALTDKVQSPVGVALLVVVVLIGAPVIEEMFFRGLLWRVLDSSGRFRRWGVIAVSAVVFAAIHLQVLQFPALLLFGVVAGVLVHRSGRLGPAVWAHVGFNAVTVIALLAAA